MDDVRAAVATGDLTRATPVTVYSADGAIKMGAAGGFAFLEAALDAPFAPSLSQDEPPRDSDDSETIDTRAMSSAAQSPTPSAARPVAPNMVPEAIAPRASRPDNPRPPKPRRIGCTMWMILIIAVLSALVYFKNQMLTEAGDAVLSALPVLSTAADPLPPVPEETTGETQSLLDRGIASATRTLRRAAALAVKRDAPSLKVTNACPIAATMMFYTFADGKWTHFDGASWDFDAGASGHPTLPDGNRIHLGNKGLFYTAGSMGNGPLAQGQYDAAIRVDGESVHFRRAQIKPLPNGDWDFTLTC